MGAVDTASPNPIKLSLNKGVVHCYNPDDRQTTEHKGWEAWLLDFEYQSNADHADERFRKPELILKMHDGDREAMFAIRLLSFAFKQFASAIENVNLRQPFVIRPWSYKNEKGDVLTGGINIWQGDVRIAEKYTDKNPNGRPAVEEKVNEVTMEKTKDSTAQLGFLKNILDTVIKPKLHEIAALNAYEEAPKHIGPAVPGQRLELPAATAPPTPALAEGAPATVGDPDDLPF